MSLSYVLASIKDEQERNRVKTHLRNQIASISKIVRKDTLLKVTKIEKLRQEKSKVLDTLRIKEPRIKSLVMAYMEQVIDHYIEQVEELDLAAVALASGNIYKNYKVKTKEEAKQDQEYIDQQLFNEEVRSTKRKVGMI